MPPMSFSITDFGTAKIVAERMDLSARQTHTLRTVFEKIVYVEMPIITETQIASRGRRGGGSYAALAEKTIERKGDSRIFYTEGSNWKYSTPGHDTLVNSLIRKRAKYSVRNVNNQGFEFGTRRPWANVHQQGSTKRHIPRRPFLRILPSDEEKWNGMMLRHLLRSFQTPVKPEQA